MKTGALYYSVDGDPAWTGRFDRVIQVPAGISTKEELIGSLARELSFPEWFGGNWDALQDCLCDLSWLTESSVLLMHCDLPLSEDPDAAAIYIEILSEALKLWRSEGEERLGVAFPNSVRPEIESKL